MVDLIEEVLQGNAGPGDYVLGYRIKAVDRSRELVVIYDDVEDKNFEAEYSSLIADPISPSAAEWGNWKFSETLVSSNRGSWRNLDTWDFSFPTGNRFEPIGLTLPDARGQVYSYPFMIRPNAPYQIRGANIAPPVWPAARLTFTFRVAGVPATTNDWSTGADSLSIAFPLRNRAMDITTFVASNQNQPVWVIPSSTGMMSRLRRFRIIPVDNERFLVCVDVEWPTAAAWGGLQFTPDLGTYSETRDPLYLSSGFANPVGSATVSSVCRRWLSGDPPPMAVLATLDPNSVLPVSSSGINTAINAAIDKLRTSANSSDDAIRETIRNLSVSFQSLQRLAVSWLAAITEKGGGITIYNDISKAPTAPGFAFFRRASGEIIIQYRADDVWNEWNAGSGGTEEARKKIFADTMTWVLGEVAKTGAAVPSDINDVIEALSKEQDTQAETIKTIEAAVKNITEKQKEIADLDARIDAIEGAATAAELKTVQDEVNLLKGKFDALTPVTAQGGVTRSDATPFITIPDRAGVRFDKLKFTFADSRKNSAGGFEYPSRTTVVEVPASWLSMGAVAGRTDWVASALTFEDPTSTTTPKATITRDSLKRTFSYGSGNVRADYDVWLNFRRNATSWDIWFQGQHITTDRKPMNQYCGVYDIAASYVTDASAVDPVLAPIQKSISDNAAAIKANSDRITALEGAGKTKVTVNDGKALLTPVAGPALQSSFAGSPSTLPTATSFSTSGTGDTRIEVPVTCKTGDKITVAMASRIAGGSLRVTRVGEESVIASTSGATLSNDAGGTATVTVDGDWAITRRVFQPKAGETSITIIVLLPAGKTFAGPVIEIESPVAAPTVDLAPLTARVVALEASAEVKVEPAGQQIAATSLATMTPTGSVTAPADTVPMPSGVGGDRIVMMPGASVAWGFGVTKGVQRELRWAISSGINSDITLIAGFTFTAPNYAEKHAGVTMSVSGNWRIFKMLITPDRALYNGVTSVSHGTQLVGPSLHAVGTVSVGSNQLVTAADLAAYAKKADLPAPVDFTPLHNRIAALEAKGAAVDARWFPAERDYDKTYLRRTKSGTQATSISFDWMPAGTGGPVMSVSLPALGAPISSWPISQFWGVAALFINVTPPGGVAQTIAVCASIDGVVEIGVGAATGAPSASIGRVRSVMIDGIPADTL